MQGGLGRPAGRTRTLSKGRLSLRNSFRNQPRLLQLQPRLGQSGLAMERPAGVHRPCWGGGVRNPVQRRRVPECEAV
jgi:hypothetical protein